MNTHSSEFRTTVHYLRVYKMAQFPSSFACPLTGLCMLNPVMAADGHTYEHAAIFHWLQHQCTSPKTGTTLDFLDLYPNHEKKAEIDAWRKSQMKPQQSEVKKNRPRLDKLTWATTPSQAVDELEKLIEMVKANECEFSRQQLNRIRGCLSADQHMWTQKVQRKFQALEGHCLGLLQAAAPSVSTDSPLPALSGDDVWARAAKRKREMRMTTTPLKPQDVNVPQPVAPLELDSCWSEFKVEVQEDPQPVVQQGADEFAQTITETFDPADDEINQWINDGGLLDNRGLLDSGGLLDSFDSYEDGFDQCSPDSDYSDSWEPEPDSKRIKIDLGTFEPESLLCV